MPTSRYLMPLLAFAFLGCSDTNTPAPPAPADAPSPAKSDPVAETSPPQRTEREGPPVRVQTEPPPAAWTDDVKAMTFPETPASGRINGQPFRLEQAHFASDGVLTLRHGKESAGLVEVHIPLSVKKNEVPAGRTYEVTLQGAAEVPVIKVRWKPEDRDFEAADFGTDYALRLEFGQENGGRLAGRIYLCLPDPMKSFLAGTFTADVEPDYSKPPRPEDAPFVAGKITLKGRDKYDLLAGIVGVQADGTPYANLIGSEVAPGGDLALTSDNFAPQLTTLACDTDAGCTYRHVKLPPGRYLVYVRLGDRFLDGRWVDVKPGTRMTLDLTLDPSTAGSLDVTLPKAAREGVRLIPLDEAGKLPDLGDAFESMAVALSTDVPAKDGKVVLDGLRPGSYRALAGNIAKDVTVKSRETVKLDLSAP